MSTTTSQSRGAQATPSVSDNHGADPAARRGQSSRGARRRPGRVARRIIATVVAAASVTLTMTAAPASASPTPYDFSPFLPSSTYWVDDCRVQLGWVYDGAPAPSGWHHIGGVRVNCNSRHSVIDAVVAMYYYTGSGWVQYGNGTHGARYSSYGSGTGVSGVLRTPAYCVGGLRANYWMVGATVRTERAGLTNYSTPVRNPSQGC